MKKQARFEVRPVSWASDEPVKFQAFLEFPISDKRTIRLVGDPASCRDFAVENLITEFNSWQEAMAAFSNVLKKEIKKDNEKDS